LNRFADALQNETYHVDPEDRMEMYSKTLDSMYWAGQVSATADNASIHWVLGVAEHSLTGEMRVITPKGVQHLRDAWVGDVDHVLSVEGMVGCRKTVRHTPKECLRISVDLGYRLECTPDHRVKVYLPESGEIVFREAGQVRPGDVMVLKRGGVSAVEQSEERLQGELLGFFDADGHLNRQRRGRVGVGFTVSLDDTDVGEWLRMAYERLFGYALHDSAHSRSTRVRVYRDHRQESGRLFAGWGLKGDGIPDQVWASEALLVGYLRGLFTADGSVSKNTVTVSTTKPGLARDVQDALLALGIVSKLTRKEKATAYKQQHILWHVSVLGGKNLQKFMEVVGFLAARKTNATRPLELRYTKHDVVPGFAPIAKRLIGNLRTPESMRRGSQNPGRRVPKWVHSLKGLPGALSMESVRKLVDGGWIKDESVKTWLDRGLVFLPVTAIEPIGVREVYDVVNSATGTFVANGFWVSNCSDCLELAANSPYTRKMLPAVPRDGSSRCLVGCKCHLSVSYDEPPAIDDLQTKPWKPMREFDAAPPTGTRPPTTEERGFIENLGLRIRFETDLARSAGQQPGNKHASIAAGIAAALASFLAARKIWAPPTWAADDTSMVTGEEFEAAFEQDHISLAELEAMSDEEFDQFLEDYKERFPSDVPRKVKCIVDRAVAQSGRVQDDKARNAMRLLLEFNAFHDRIGRFAHAPATDGGGAYGGTVTVRQGSGKFMGQAFAHGHEDDIEIPEGKQVSVLYNPTNGHMGWMDGIGSHEIFLRAMNVCDAEESEQYVHVNILGYDNGPYRKSLGINVTSAAATVGTHATEAGAVNRTFAMLRTKGFPMETPVQWRQWNGINRDVKLGDTVQVDVEDPTALARRRLMPRGLLTSEELARSVAAEIVRQIRPE
jgi:intein/homing endonuclease